MIILTPVVNWERVPVAEADTHHALVLFSIERRDAPLQRDTPTQY
jgi:hypothetical protein